ncbi:MAG: Methyltransferase type 12 [Herbaspirillum sp.]|nr:Methyltransferase type 12 [Herbaspirillum sp.]
MNMEPLVNRLLEPAIRHHLAGRHEQAEALYRATMADHPASAAPKYWLGFMLQQTGRLDEAGVLISESLQLDDTHAEWHYNFGILLSRQDKTEQGIQAFLDAIALDPRNYFSWTNLGSLYEKIGDTAKAEQAYAMAAQLDPDCPDAFYLLSSLCVDQKRFREATHFHNLGFIAGPREDKPRIKLSHAYYALGRIEDAVGLIDAWLAEQPDEPVAQHLAIAYKGLPAPPRCADDYVESTFDDFAANFETTLSKLKYAGPQALNEVLKTLAFAPGSMRSLDLGCGTGLGGICLKPISSLLEGVDLSGRMLDEARRKGIYDRLTKSEIGLFLTHSTGSDRQYDLIVCMDTLIYFGALEQLLAAISARLKPGGWTVLTIETLAGGPEATADYHLNSSGRYSHRGAYVSRLLLANGFEPPIASDLTIRMEAGSPVAGQILRARKRAD